MTNSNYNNSDLDREKAELLSSVTPKKAKEKRPSNAALGIGFIFGNLIFALLDLISGYTVYLMTNFALYGVLTFLSGFLPLLLHEFLWRRALANQFQKKIALWGAGFALLSIVVVSGLSGFVNIVGIGNVGAQTTEIVTLLFLVTISTTHAILTFVYYYSDEGIRAQQQIAQVIANAEREIEMINIADRVVTAKRVTLHNRHLVEEKHSNPEAVQRVLELLSQDDNHNGIPDFMETELEKKGSNVTEQRAAGKITITKSSPTAPLATALSLEEVESGNPLFSRPPVTLPIGARKNGGSEKSL
jgi:hypothetical protein